jgi:hypothetical protein
VSCVSATRCGAFPGLARRRFTDFSPTSAREASLEVPAPLGYDALGREVLTFIPGAVPMNCRNGFGPKSS